MRYREFAAGPPIQTRYYHPPAGRFIAVREQPTWARTPRNLEVTVLHTLSATRTKNSTSPFLSPNDALGVTLIRRGPLATLLIVSRI